METGSQPGTLVTLVLRTLKSAAAGLRVGERDRVLVAEA
jgi:hypothetical protein